MGYLKGSDPMDASPDFTALVARYGNRIIQPLAGQFEGKVIQPVARQISGLPNVYP